MLAGTSGCPCRQGLLYAGRTSLYGQLFRWSSVIRLPFHCLKKPHLSGLLSDKWVTSSEWKKSLGHCKHCVLFLSVSAGKGKVSLSSLPTTFKHIQQILKTSGCLPVSQLSPHLPCLFLFAKSRLFASLLKLSALADICIQVGCERYGTGERNSRRISRESRYHYRFAPQVL